MYFVWMTLMTMPMPRGDCLQQPLSVCNPNCSQSALLHNKISEAGLSANSPASLREKLLTHTVTFYESIHILRINTCCLCTRRNKCQSKKHCRPIGRMYVGLTAWLHTFCKLYRRSDGTINRISQQ